MASHFFGIAKICLWYRGYNSNTYPPSFPNQESGPPISGYYLEILGNGENLGSGFTGDDGCLSLPFESFWPGRSLNIGFSDGPTGTISSSTSSQTVDFDQFSMDYLPLSLEPTLDCSSCNVYYPENNFEDAIPGSTPGSSSPLIDHPCSTNTFGYNCCGYDFVTSQCGVQDFFPEFSFLHKCDNCRTIEKKDVTTDRKTDKTPLDCTVCTSYYPESAMSTSKGDRGSIEPLTKHACTGEQKHDGRWGDTCCAYDWETEQCGVENFFLGSTYPGEPRSSFIYPCADCGEGRGSAAKGGLGSAAKGGIIAASVVFPVLLIFCIIYYYKVRKAREPYYGGGEDTRMNPNPSGGNRMDQIAQGLRKNEIAIATPVPIRTEDKDKNTNMGDEFPMRLPMVEAVVVAPVVPSAPPAPPEGV